MEKNCLAQLLYLTKKVTETPSIYCDTFTNVHAAVPVSQLFLACPKKCYEKGKKEYNVTVIMG